MKNVEIKKMSIANIENRLTPEEMENVMAGKWDCNSVTSAFCGATFGLMFAGPFSCLAAATGIAAGMNPLVGGLVTAACFLY